MAKWADYGICRVKYNKDHTAIIEVEIKPDQGEQFGATQKMTRARVIQEIDNGRTFITIYSREGNWQKGAAVYAVTIDWAKYLRTTNNSVKQDNLGELPEYE